MNGKIFRFTAKMAFAILAMIPVAQVPVFAQADSDSRENGRKLEGTWSIVTTTRDCVTGAAGRTFPALETFARGGTSVEFSLGSATSGQPNLGSRTTSQGIWRYVSNGVYSSASQNYRFGADNAYAGTTRRDAEILLHDNGNSFISSGTEKFFDLAGVLTITRCNTQAGTRFE